MTDQKRLRFTFTEYHMGIDARIVVYAPSEENAKTACRAAFQRIANLEAIMSDYRPDSELMRLCRTADKKPIQVSKELFKVLARSQELSEKSDGAFDVTVGPFVQLWRTARREKKLPDFADILAARRLIGWEMVRLDESCRTVRLEESGMKLDLGGIAKGYAGDEALHALRRNGVRAALIELGGDIVLGDAPPDSKGWRISVPNASSPGVPAEMYLSNCAVSSSGDTEQFVEIGGVRYSHVVDPRTGYGLSNRVQATVIAKNGLLADPVSTALTVLPESKRGTFLKNLGVRNVYIRSARD